MKLPMWEPHLGEWVALILDGFRLLVREREKEE